MGRNARTTIGFPNSVEGSWIAKITVLPHISNHSGKIIKPFTSAFRRTTYHIRGERRIDWITEKEYVYLTLQGKT